MTIIEEIRGELFRMQDTEYGDFQSKLMPAVERETVIGVRTPALRKYARELAKRENIRVFLEDLPHTWFDENQLHAFILSEMKEFDSCVAGVLAFLPYVDNWATCDQMSPKVFKKHRGELLPYIRKWLAADDTYTVRFAAGMLMEHFLDEEFEPYVLEMAAGIHSEEYYVRMMIAWFFATALVKQYGQTISYLEQGRLDVWTHNKTIQKAIESYRITPDKKEYLRSLKKKSVGV